MISRSFPFDLFSERRISGLTCFFYLRSQENIEKIHLKWISHRGAINGWIGLGSDGYLWVMWGKEHLTVLIKFSSCFKGVDGWQELPPAFCFYSISKKVDLLLKMAEVDIEQIFPDRPDQSEAVWKMGKNHFISWPPEVLIQSHICQLKYIDQHWSIRKKDV